MSRLMCFAAVFAASFAILLSGAGNKANAETRTLKLYYIHTGERAEITFKKNGKYIQSGLTQANRLLRDWRRNEPTQMSPQLLDLIWSVYKSTGSNNYIHVICGYRSPGTNNMLRRRSKGVAKHSQHMLGHAMDFYIPDVKLAKLREIGLKMGVGGVGYYPRSGSPFVHLDVGRVRHWPKMSAGELARIFPDGKTLHIPSNGVPLKGYQLALAEAKNRKSGDIEIIKDADKKKPNLLQLLLGAGGEDAADEESSDVPGPVPVKSTRETGVVAGREPDDRTPEAPKQLEAVEPKPGDSSVEVAALPSGRVPVPTLAPRSGTLDGAALALAIVQTQDQAPNQVNGEAQDQVAEEGALALAAIPVPAKRPELAPAQQAVLAALDNSVQDTVAQGELAFAPIPQERPQLDATGQDSKAADIDKSGSANTGNSEVAAMSPDEIFSLRRQVSKKMANLKAKEGKATGQKNITLAAKGQSLNGQQQAKSNTGMANVKMAKLVAKGMVERPVSLDMTETEDKATVGKWALNAGASLNSVSDMRPPAYGKNAIRALPESGLPASGFVKNSSFDAGQTSLPKKKNSDPV